MQQWCRYCQTTTSPIPARAGRPRECSVCFRPYATDHPQPSSHVTATPTRRPDSGVNSAPSVTPEAWQGFRSPCFHLHDRNNSRTFHPAPHKRNTCYARLQMQRHRWRPGASTVPTAISKEHQRQYCFGDYARCPYFLPPGTPPVVVEADDEATGLPVSTG
jgi:hypothetical protein